MRMNKENAHNNIDRLEQKILELEQQIISSKMNCKEDEQNDIGANSASNLIITGTQIGQNDFLEGSQLAESPVLKEKQSKQEEEKLPTIPKLTLKPMLKVRSKFKEKQAKPKPTMPPIGKVEIIEIDSESDKRSQNKVYLSKNHLTNVPQNSKILELENMVEETYQLIQENEISSPQQLSHQADEILSIVSLEGKVPVIQK